MKLTDQLRAAIRVRQMSYRTEETYVEWFKRYVKFHGMKHPMEMGEREIGAFLSDLAGSGVSRAIQNAFGFKVWGNGNQIDNNLPKNKFKQVNLSLEEALKIPGLVLTWEKTSSRLGSIYGHTAITTGDGRSSVSDFIERNTLGAGGRSGFKVFMPTM